MAKAQEAARIERREQVGGSFQARRVIEIDQKIAAENDVEPPLAGDARRIDEVAGREDYGLTQIVDQLALVAALGLEIGLANRFGKLG